MIRFSEYEEYIVPDDNFLLYALDFILLFLLIYTITKFILTNKRALNIVFASLPFFIVGWLATFLGLEASSVIYQSVLAIYFFAVIVVLSPEIRKKLDVLIADRVERDTSSDYSKKQLVEAVIYLADNNIGALITIEKQQSLDQYAERAVPMNSEISKELIINIFSPTTPLHDGAVIIRGNKIRCAAAYFSLTNRSGLDKTTGSRHRAGLGISEITDALTIIVSEETGAISIAVEGIMLKAKDKEKVLEYLDTFLK